MTNVKNRLKELFGADKIGCLTHYKDYIEGYNAYKSFYEKNIGKKKCFLLPTADYGNLGDLAITEAQLQLLHENFKGLVIEIQTGEVWQQLKCMKKYMNSDDLICLQGGGNMSDFYPMFEFERCTILSFFPDVHIIQMPQTMSYSSPNSSLLSYTKKVYSKTENLHIFAREAISLPMMKHAYPNTDVQLVPDIVLGIDTQKIIGTLQQPERTNITTILRNDIEKKTSSADSAQLITALHTTNLPVTETDTSFEQNGITPVERQKLLKNFLLLLMRSELAITDRLHGMVFSALTETPCIVLSNNNHKIAGVYEWIKDLNYIQFANSVDEAISMVPKLLEVTPERFPRKKMLEQFGPLFSEIQKS